MSGIEVIGTIATTSQLLGYIFHIANSLSELRDHIQHCPARIQSYSEQLESLSGTIQYIQGSQKHHVHIVEDHLRAILEKVDTLNCIIRTSFPRATHSSATLFFRIPRERAAERRIKEAFTALERDKSNLMLCISVTLDKISSNRPPEPEMESINESSSKRLVEVDEESVKTDETLVEPAPSTNKQPGVPSKDIQLSNPLTSKSSTIARSGLPTKRSSASEFYIRVDRQQPRHEFNGNNVSCNGFALIGGNVDQADFNSNRANYNTVSMIGPTNTASQCSYENNEVRGCVIATLGTVDPDTVPKLREHLAGFS